MALLTELINYTDIYDKKLIELWVNIKDVLLKNHIVGEKVINNATANKYIGDMYGMLKEIGLEDVVIFPHILVNGYNSSRDYDGLTTKILLIDPAILNRYYLSYLKNK